MYLSLTFCLGLSSLWGQPTLKTEPVVVSAQRNERAAQPETLAILFGINSYVSMSPLKYAEKDATDFHYFIEESYGKNNVTVYTFLNQDVTYDNIHLALMHAQRGHAGELKKVFFLFSGHGGTDSKLTQDAYLYLNESNFHNRALMSTDKYSLEDLRTDIGGLVSKGIEVVVILDACHAGGLFPEKIYEALDSWKKEKITVSFLACAIDEKAMEIAELQNGLFIHYFLKGARNEADTDGNNIVDVREMRHYLGSVIPEKAASIGYKQTPQIISFNDTLVISSIKNPVFADTRSKPDVQQQSAFPVRSTLRSKLASKPTAPDSSKIIEEKIKQSVKQQNFDDAYNWLMKYKSLDTSINYYRLQYQYIGAVRHASLGVSDQLVDYCTEKFFEKSQTPTITSPADPTLYGGTAKPGFSIPKLEIYSKYLTYCLSLLEPKESLYREILYRKYILDGFANQATEEIDRAIKLNPDFAYAYLILAKIYYDKSQSTTNLGAVYLEYVTKNLQRCRELAPENTRIKTLLESFKETGVLKTTKDDPKPAVKNNDFFTLDNLYQDLIHTEDSLGTKRFTTQSIFAFWRNSTLQKNDTAYLLKNIVPYMLKLPASVDIAISASITRESNRGLTLGMVYTPNRSQEFSQRISKERAQAIKAFLVKEGIEENRIKLVDSDNTNNSSYSAKVTFEFTGTLANDYTITYLDQTNQVQHINVVSYVENDNDTISYRISAHAPVSKLAVDKVRLIRDNKAGTTYNPSRRSSGIIVKTNGEEINASRIFEGNESISYKESDTTALATLPTASVNYIRLADGTPYDPKTKQAGFIIKKDGNTINAGYIAYSKGVVSYRAINDKTILKLNSKDIFSIEYIDGSVVKINDN